MTDSLHTSAGVWCRMPGCGTLTMWVIDTSHAAEGVVRVRKCRKCGALLWTIEQVLATNPAKSGVREAYPPVTRAPDREPGDRK